MKTPAKDSAQQHSSDFSKSSGKRRFPYFFRLSNILWVWKHEPKIKSPLYLVFMQDAQESDSENENNAGEEESKTCSDTEPEPEVSITGRSVQTPGRLDTIQTHVISIMTDGASCKTEDSHKEQLHKSHPGFAQRCFYPPDSDRHLQDLSVSRRCFPSDHLNTWYHGGNMDAVSCGLSLASPVQAPTSLGFPMSLQQHAQIQVQRSPY